MDVYGRSCHILIRKFNLWMLGSLDSNVQKNILSSHIYYIGISYRLKTKLDDQDQYKCNEY